MPSSADYLQYCIEQLRPLEVTYRKMMGEYLLYTDGILWGGVYDDRLLLKVTPSNAHLDMPLDTPYAGAKPMYRLDVDHGELLVQSVTNALSDLR
jgi:hypothetical protein